MIFRLPDGTLIKTGAGIPAEKLVNGVWMPAEGVTIGDINESQPLTDKEISDLASSGIPIE